MSGPAHYYCYITLRRFLPPELGPGDTSRPWSQLAPTPQTGLTGPRTEIYFQLARGGEGRDPPWYDPPLKQRMLLNIIDATMPGCGWAQPTLIAQHRAQDHTGLDHTAYPVTTLTSPQRQLRARADLPGCQVACYTWPASIAGDLVTVITGSHW